MDSTETQTTAQTAAPTAAPIAPASAPSEAPPLHPNGASHPENTISADEIALYDRQIRLWGMKAQEKIRSADILLITVKALANEIAKNLVLAGINSLTIVDSAVVTPADLGAQFLLSEEHVGMNRAEAASANLRKLNPRVKVIVDQDDVRSKGPSYFEPFSFVIATELEPDALVHINTATRLLGKPFYAAGSHGLYGYIFADLIQHEFTIERNVTGNATKLQSETRTRSIIDVSVKEANKGAKGERVELVTKRELYSTWALADAARLPDEYVRSPRRLKAVTPILSCLRALFEFVQETGGRLPSHSREDLERFTTLVHGKHRALGLPETTLRADVLRSFLCNVGCELSPVTAILGGQLAQDVINVLSATEQPIQNMVIFDGDRMEANMYPLHPDEQLGKGQLETSSVEATAAAFEQDVQLLAAGVIPPVDVAVLNSVHGVAAEK